MILPLIAAGILYLSMPVLAKRIACWLARNTPEGYETKEACILMQEVSLLLILLALLLLLSLSLLLRSWPDGWYVAALVFMLWYFMIARD